MLRKVDCVMVRVPDLAAAEEFYARVFGLRPLWRDAVSVGMGLAETDAEIVLHTMDLPAGHSVYYLVDDVRSAVAAATAAGCTVRTPPLAVPIGECAVLDDPFGNPVGVIDMTAGARTPIG
jgi:lactoylglutathione lyase